MASHFEYKGYVGSAEVDIESHSLFGRLLFIQDVIGYSAGTPKELEAAFQEAVDQYLQTCQQFGDKPDVPFKGTFNVRVGPDIHRDVALAARRRNMGLNEFVCTALADAVRGGERTVQHLHRHEVVVTTGETKKVVATTDRWESFGGTTVQH